MKQVYYGESDSNERRLVVSQKDQSDTDLLQMFKLGPKTPRVIAGPCAIESKEFLTMAAEELKFLGVKFLRGGAYKPRTSPYEFQGLGEEGLKILNEVGTTLELLTVTEVVDTRSVEVVARYADVLQIGSRNMFNYELLKEVGKASKPVLLKRGLNATIREFLLAAEYIVLQGNSEIILCERGIRTYETSTRNTLDISAVPILKIETGLPVVVDVSHSLGRKDIIVPVAKAAFAAGADSIMVEVHPYPQRALSDKRQQLDFNEFRSFMSDIKDYY